MNAVAVACFAGEVEVLKLELVGPLMIGLVENGLAVKAAEQGSVDESAWVG